MSDEAAERIANDLMSQNMLDVPVVVAAKVIARGLNVIASPCTHEPRPHDETLWYCDDCWKNRPTVALDSLLAAAIERTTKYKDAWHEWCESGEIGPEPQPPTPSSIRDEAERKGVSDDA